MSRSGRLVPAAEQRTREVDQAARSLAAAIDTETAERARLDQLQRYREEYLADFRASQAAGSMRPDAVRTYAGLLQQLEQAVDQQRERLVAAGADVTRAREAWRVARGRLQAIDRTIERLRSEERRVADRREQREQDDHTARSVPGADQSDGEPM